MLDVNQGLDMLAFAGWNRETVEPWVRFAGGKHGVDAKKRAVLLPDNSPPRRSAQGRAEHVPNGAVGARRDVERRSCGLAGASICQSVDHWRRAGDRAEQIVAASTIDHDCPAELLGSLQHSSLEGLEQRVDERSE